MKRRTLLQGLLAIPLIGVAAKAFSLPVNEKPGVAIANPKAVAAGSKREISHILYFSREKIKAKGWEGIVPIMVLREKQAVPLLVLEHCEAAIDINNNFVLKDRKHGQRELSQGEAMCELGRAYFHMGPDAPYELTDDIRVKNGLAFANLREASTGEML